MAHAAEVKKAVVNPTELPKSSTPVNTKEGMDVRQLNQMTEGFQEDAPLCDQCGAITVRNGACYRCFNCGNSMGCS